MIQTKRISYLLIALLLAFAPANAQKRFLNDKVQNRPYADNRAWHLGFSVGMHTQNLLITHNGYVSESGQQWQIEQPNYDPGFCVNGLIAFRLNNYFSLRFSPGLYFGNRTLRMLDPATGARERQSLKSTFIVAPIDIKYAAVRLRNMRPYMLAGVMPAIDVTKRQGELIQLKSYDTYLSVGFGCDFYLPYFKFIPELKFCFGLNDMLQTNRPDLQDDPSKYQFTQSIKKATSRMIVLTLYFE